MPQATLGFSHTLQIFCASITQKQNPKHELIPQYRTVHTCILSHPVNDT